MSVNDYITAASSEYCFPSCPWFGSQRSCHNSFEEA